ncbi:MAG: 2-phospho-L-lactate guanylyltransferase [Chloroflexi bacterium]|nr:MAG: 2-phospho-L-lactate guanylyltransferase [Chloroflexota bacterium]
MTYRALIPVKMLNEVKSRLAPYLTAQQRAELVLDMLHHVIDTLRESEALAAISVVSPDTAILQQVQRWGAHALQEEVHGHNPALTAAARRELAAGATALLTISADLPLLRAVDIQCMIEQSRQYAVVLAPARDGTGTNALLMRPPLALPYVSGPGSNTHTALDIDTIEDLTLLQRYEACLKN